MSPCQAYRQAYSEQQKIASAPSISRSEWQQKGACEGAVGGAMVSKRRGAVGLASVGAGSCNTVRDFKTNDYDWQSFVVTIDTFVK